MSTNSTAQVPHLANDKPLQDSTVGVAIWTTVEVGIGITAACIATLRPLMRIVFERFGVNSSARSRARTPSHGLHGGGLGPNGGLSLNGLDARSHGIVTTITGNHESEFEPSKSWHTRRGSSQERLASDESQKSPRDMVMVLDEVNVSYEVRMERDGDSQRDGRCGSEGGDEEHGLSALPPVRCQ